MKRVYLFAVVAILVFCFPVFAAPPCANGQCPVKGRAVVLGTAAKPQAKSVTSHRKADRPLLKLLRPFKGRCGR